MANEIRIGIDVKGEQAAKQKLGVVEKAAEQAGDAIEDMGGQAVAAGKATDKVADDFKGAAGEANHLQREVDELTASYTKLLAQFNETGDESLKKDIGKERRKLNAAKRNLKDILPDAGSAVEAGASVGKQIAEGIGDGLGAAGPYVSGAVAAAAALAVPGIAATISGAVLGGVGVGGIVGGIALAAEDERVKAAGADVGETLMSEFSSAAQPFVDPLLRSLDKVGNSQWADKLTPSFDRLADHVDPLTDGLLKLVDNVIPGLEDAIDAAGPSLDVLADGLPEIGSSLGNFFSTIGENPDAAAHALELLIDTITDVIDASAFMISGLSESYEKAYGLAEALGVIEEETQVLGWKLGETSAANRDFGEAADESAAAIERETRAISDLVDQELAMLHGTINVERAIDDLAEARKENGRSLDIEDEKGRRNTETILTGIEAVKEGMRREYDLARAHGATVEAATRAADAYRDKYAKELENAIIKTFGNTKAVRDLLAELNKLDGKKITYTVIQRNGQTGFKVDGGIQLSGDGPIYHRASGGPVQPGVDYIVGENGPERVRFGASGTVYNAAQTAAMAGAAGTTMMGGLHVTVSVEKTGTAGLDALLDWFLTKIRLDVRSTAGGSAQEFFGAGPV